MPDAVRCGSSSAPFQLGDGALSLPKEQGQAIAGIIVPVASSSYSTLDHAVSATTTHITNTMANG